MSVAILCGGGPAPGMNTVVGSIVKSFTRHGIRVLGLHHGYTGLFREDAKVEELDFSKADWIFNRGGSYLKMSRFKPTNEDFKTNFNLKLFKDNDIELLVTVGGDDTASTANRVAKFLRDKGYPVANIHVPKTIDNDLPLPNHSPTFGYTTAEDSGAKIAATIYEDARTSENWFVIAAMGRSAGHLAFGIGSACHLPMIVIPEMFNHAEITVDRIVNLVVSAMIKRKIMDVNYGVVIISEGVFHKLSDEEIEKSGINFSYDDHGHPELGKISKAQLFNELLEKKYREIGLKIKSRPVELGYEVRCINPVGYDLVYCTLLGNGVYKLFKDGATGCMVYINQAGDVSPLYLKDLEGPDGKIPPRLVDIENQKSQSIIKNIMQYITEEDYTAARKYVTNPEIYDFNKILNWD
ncbi:MAG: 6-phosphofructokinase [Candidatus Marinimicrobia bacterium]|nr:6-phosphofructokinase [Candidatus Neomarinimicrobiota bacterium]